MTRTGLSLLTVMAGFVSAIPEARGALMLPELPVVVASACDGAADSCDCRSAGAAPIAPERRECPEQPVQPAQELPAALAGTGSMSGPSSNGPSSGPPGGAAVMCETAEVDSPALVSYLRLRPHLPAPEPYLDGVFRPPRRVV